jgi:hypothetical protein
VSLRPPGVWAITAGVVAHALSGCMSLESLRASHPTYAMVVRGSAPVIARCIQSELNLTVSDSDPAGTEFALLARCRICLQGDFYEFAIWQLDVLPGQWDQVRIELRENSMFLLGTGDPWKKAEHCMQPKG